MGGREEGRKRALSTPAAPGQPDRLSSQVPSFIQNIAEAQVWASENLYFTEGAFLLRNGRENVGSGIMSSQHIWKNRFQPVDKERETHWQRLILAGARTTQPFINEKAWPAEPH